MAYLTPREYDKLQLEILNGSWDKPFFKELPKWDCVSKYLGYTLKWDKTPVEEWKIGSGKSVVYYCYPRYKKGHERFVFTEWDVDQIYLIYKQLKDDGHYDEELQKAWMSLDEEIMLSTLYRKIKEIIEDQSLKKNEKFR